MKPIKNVGEALQFGYGALLGSSPSHKLDAELLLSEATGKNRPSLIAHPESLVSDEAVGKYLELINRRSQCEPVAYLLGRKEFFGVALSVNSSVLVPRPETELLVEEGFKFLTARDQPFRVLDLGVGSGAISVALALELRKLGRQFEIVGVDRSDAALTVCRENVKQFDLEKFVSLRHGRWFEPLQHETFDLILSNPPYVADGDREISPELKFEPAEALFSGPDGLDDIRLILAGVRGHLKPGGVLICEFGVSQRDAISRLLSDQGFNYDFLNDLSQRARAFKASID